MINYTKEQREYITTNYKSGKSITDILDGLKHDLDLRISDSSLIKFLGEKKLYLNLLQEQSFAIATCQLKKSRY